MDKLLACQQNEENSNSSLILARLKCYERAAKRLLFGFHVLGKRRRNCWDTIKRSYETWRHKILDVVLSFLSDSQIGVDGVDRALAHIAVAEMRSLGVVVRQPAVEVSLEGVY